MNTSDKKHEQGADALEALAGGLQDPAAEAEELVNPLGEPAHDRFTPLIRPSELGLPDVEPEAGLEEAEAVPAADGPPDAMAAAEGDASVGVAMADPPGDAPAAVGGIDDLLFDDAAGAGAAARATTAAPPAMRYTRPRPTGFAALFTTTGLTKGMARRRARLFRIVMIPALVTVGLMLVASCFVTLIMLIVGNSANSIGAGRLYIHQFGKYIVIAGLPLGAILLMGAWLFFTELQKLKPIADEQDEDTDR
jgi:hypothetical protein